MGRGVHENHIVDDINFRAVEVLTDGQLVTYSATAGFVSDPAASGNTIAGLLMEAIVNRSVPNLLPVTGDDTGTTLLPRNLNARQTYVSGVCRLAVKGEIETDQVTAGETYAAGDILYSAGNGAISKVNQPGSVTIGRALAALNSDGQLRLFLDIHNAG
ncbi:hypothetical protein KAR91_50085 [Candidatus Pacearchaeota archaeon]|nr:hypothetical protein [Candidatus Pacearchaeota archaeon]